MVVVCVLISRLPLAAGVGGLRRLLRCRIAHIARPAPHLFALEGRGDSPPERRSLSIRLPTALRHSSRSRPRLGHDMTMLYNACSATGQHACINWQRLVSAGLPCNCRAWAAYSPTPCPRPQSRCSVVVAEATACPTDGGCGRVWADLRTPRAVGTGPGGETGLRLGICVQRQHA